MTAIIFVPASGNQFMEFRRESVHAAKFWGAKVFPFPVTPNGDAARRFVLSTLLDPVNAPVTRVAFLCHGFRNRIQAGFDMTTASQLAEALLKVAPLTCTVSLYCCSTGKSSRDDGAGPYIDGEDSFADWLRDELAMRGFHGTTMLTHRTAGHLSLNPDVRIFTVSADAKGGADPCLRIPLDPKASKEEKAAAVDLYRRFRGLLHSPTGRWEIADMTAAAIVATARTCEPYVDPKGKR
jgi:hypothetical protein